MSKLIYLAAPYTDPDPEVSALRAAQAAYAAAMLMSRYGFVVFSPITHGHAVVEQTEIQTTEIGQIEREPRAVVAAQQKRGNLA